MIKFNSKYKSEYNKILYNENVSSSEKSNKIKFTTQIINNLGINYSTNSDRNRSETDTYINKVVAR